MRYKIIRYAEDDRPNRVMMRGLTEEEAKAWCSREDTHGVGADGVRWFDGYRKE